MSETTTPPSEKEIAAAKKRHQRTTEGAESASSAPGSLPSWKLTRGRHVYTLGGLSLALRPLARRHAAIAYESIKSLPIMLQIASQCGLSDSTRLDFDRAAEILSALNGQDVDAQLAAAAWRDFVTSSAFDDAIGMLADTILPFLDEPNAQGFAWPRPDLPAPPAEGDGTIEDWESDCERIVAESLPAGCRWLDDAIEEELHELEIPLLLTILFDAQGGFPGDVRERFIQP